MKLKYLIYTSAFLLTACSNSDHQQTDYEQINGTDGALFSSDFESESKSCWSDRPNSGLWNYAGCGGFVNIGSGNSVELTENEISHSGSKSLKVIFYHNEDQGGADIEFAESDHIFTRFYDYYTPDFDFAFGMKIHRIRSFNKIKQINNFDSIVTITGRATYGDYDYSGINEPDMITFVSNGGPNNWGIDEHSTSFQRNQWYCIESEMKLNTPGKSDGHIRTWINGNLANEKLNIDIRGNESNKLNSVLFGGWYSNGARGDNPQTDPANISVRYIDDVVVSTKRIGCL